MVTFQQFSSKCKMRHDFADQIQVRYRHVNGEDYDTWVSGDEAMSRLNSDLVEKRLRERRNIDWDQIRKTKERLRSKTKEEGVDRLQAWLGDQAETTLGGNPIGDGLVESVRSLGSTNPVDETAINWQALLHDNAFRAKVLELAWIQLEGSFPDVESGNEPDDWI